MHIKNDIDRHSIVMSAYIFLYVKSIKDHKVCGFLFYAPSVLMG